MIVSHILASKGSDVATVEPGASLADAIQLLGTRKIGALVVTGPERTVAGILSERDIVKMLAHSGVGVLSDAVSQHMTSKVVTCEPGDTVVGVMGAMTSGRFRHMPVEQNGKLVGIISIGDVVKARLDQMAQESAALREYING